MPQAGGSYQEQPAISARRPSPSTGGGQAVVAHVRGDGPDAGPRRDARGGRHRHADDRLAALVPQIQVGPAAAVAVEVGDQLVVRRVGRQAAVVTAPPRPRWVRRVARTLPPEEAVAAAILARDQIEIAVAVIEQVGLPRAVGRAAQPDQLCAGNAGADDDPGAAVAVEIAGDAQHPVARPFADDGDAPVGGQGRARRRAAGLVRPTSRAERLRSRCLPHTRSPCVTPQSDVRPISAILASADPFWGDCASSQGTCGAAAAPQTVPVRGRTLGSLPRSAHPRSRRGIVTLTGWRGGAGVS